MITAQPWGCIWLFGGKNCCLGFFWLIPLLRIKTFYCSFVFYVSLLVRSFQVKFEQSMHTENKNWMFWNSSKMFFRCCPTHIILRSWMGECVNGSLLLIPDSTWTVTYMLFKPLQLCVSVDVSLTGSSLRFYDLVQLGSLHIIYIHFMIWKSCSLRVCVHHQGHISFGQKSADLNWDARWSFVDNYCNTLTQCNFQFDTLKCPHNTHTHKLMGLFLEVLHSKLMKTKVSP